MSYNHLQCTQAATTVVEAISNPLMWRRGTSLEDMCQHASVTSSHTSHAQCVIILDALGIHICKLYYFCIHLTLIQGTLLRLPLLWLKLFPTPLMWCRATPLEDMCQHANVTSFPMPLRTKQDSRTEQVTKANYLLDGRNWEIRFLSKDCNWMDTLYSIRIIGGILLNVHVEQNLKKQTCN